MSFTKELLEFIKEVGEFIPTIETPHQHIRRLRRSTYYGALYRLEKQGLVKKKKTRKQLSYAITEKGRHLVGQGVKLTKRNDGLATIVIFDIPEEKKRQRDIFRRYLLRNGFILLQESVLISPNKITNKLRELIEELGIRPEVIIIAGKIEHSF